MKMLTFVVQEPRRPDQVIEVHANRVLLGSGAHCDIKLPLEAAAWEHVVVTQEDGSVVARVVPTDMTAVFDGEARREAHLQAGSTVKIDTVMIMLRDITSTEPKKARTNPLRSMVMIVGGLVAAAAILILKNASAGGTPPPPRAPDPIGHEQASCPEKQGALPLAHQKLALARSKKERFRFYPRDGVDAVAYYETAAACFEVAKEHARAESALDEARGVQASVRDDFHASRVRLERALVRKDARNALAQVKFQRELLQGGVDADAYITWLALLQSKLEGIIAKDS
jgi:hypothetical protein